MSIGWWLLALIVGVVGGLCVRAQLTVRWTKKDGSEVSKTFGKVED